MERSEFSTIDNASYGLCLECNDCGHRYKIDSAAKHKFLVMAGVPPTEHFKDLFHIIKHRLKCSNCDAKGKVKLRYVALAQEKSLNTLNQSKTSSFSPKKNSPKKKKKVIHKSKRKKNVQNSGYKLCDDCGDIIPKERLRAVPHTNHCTDCQAQLESVNPNSYTRRIDEGLAGTREGHKRMRGQQWSEMVRRHRE